MISNKEYPRKDDGHKYWALNDVATSYFIMGNAYQGQQEWSQAKQAYKKVIEEYSYAQAWDIKGWFWKVSVAAREELKKISRKK